MYEARTRVGGRCHSVTAGPGYVLDRGGSFVNTDHADMLTLLDENWSTWAPRFDQLSVTDYLDQHADTLGAPFARELLENAIRTEYGVEPSESSALQLLFLLPTVDGDHVEVPGYSDEAFVVEGGVGQLPEALASALGKRVELGRVLVRFEELSQSHRLTFADVAGFDPKVWRSPAGFVNGLWTDQGYSAAWDGTQRQDDRPDGALTFFLGGDEVGKRPSARTLVRRFDSVIDGAREAYTGFNLATDWANDPFTRGAYVNFRPGQLRRGRPGKTERPRTPGVTPSIILSPRPPPGASTQIRPGTWHARPSPPCARRW